MEDRLTNPITASQNKFPILKLPDEAKMEVVRSMESEDQVSLSYCSKAAKKLIIALKVTTNYFTVEINIDRWIINASFNDSSINLEIYRRHSDSPEADFKYHLNHLLSILNRSHINDLHFQWPCDFHNVNEILNILSGRKIRALFICTLINDDVFCHILRSKIHSYKLLLEKNPFKNPLEIQKVFNRNYEHIHLYSTLSPTIDELLIINSEKIYIYESTLTEKHLNIFLKLWRKGSNPRLKLLTFSVGKELNESVIMDGIQFERNLEEREFENHQKINEGLDLKTMDGTKGTLVLTVSINISFIDFYVWR